MMEAEVIFIWPLSAVTVLSSLVTGVLLVAAVRPMLRLSVKKSTFVVCAFVPGAVEIMRTAAAAHAIAFFIWESFSVWRRVFDRRSGFAGVSLVVCTITS